jgi:hypothetical protein
MRFFHPAAVQKTVHEASDIGTRVKYDESQTRNDPHFLQKGNETDFFFKEGLVHRISNYKSSIWVKFLAKVSRNLSSVSERAFHPSALVDATNLCSSPHARRSNKAATHRERTETKRNLSLCVDFDSFRFGFYSTQTDHLFSTMLSPTRRATDSFDRCVGTPSRVQVRREANLATAFAGLGVKNFFVFRFARVSGLRWRRWGVVASGGTWRGDRGGRRLVCRSVDGLTH